MITRLRRAYYDWRAERLIGYAVRERRRIPRDKREHRDPRDLRLTRADLVFVYGLIAILWIVPGLVEVLL